ncbi:Schizosaccharomyces specific protein [Schizosaccharomyces osmophilus]|uniref:Schizosaccharomyces specific protein n=1 Tax=Schizosaccharomyces osmophilus TaxID=2545709 RepID=A0AAE9WCK8_9SCHI|nr:Schizosaccharomyces specific protein [Schizosaccharomyces osmophilus]WBW73871.1 Schizosaccharomyces specific protein [Schizosaccharomyces osmophilus]
MGLITRIQNLERSGIWVLRNSLKNTVQDIQKQKEISKNNEKEKLNALGQRYVVKGHKPQRDTALFLSSRWDETTKALEDLIRKHQINDSSSIVLVDQPFPITEKVIRTLTQRGFMRASLYELTTRRFGLQHKGGKVYLSKVPFPFRFELLMKDEEELDPMDQDFYKTMDLVSLIFNSEKGKENCIPYKDLLVYKLLDLATLPSVAALELLYSCRGSPTSKQAQFEYSKKYLQENMEIITKLPVSRYLNFTRYNTPRFYRVGCHTKSIFRNVYLNQILHKNEILTMLDFLILKGNELQLPTTYNSFFRDTLKYSNGSRPTEKSIKNL